MVATCTVSDTVDAEADVPAVALAFLTSGVPVV
jgi:hypothetical protein